MIKLYYLIFIFLCALSSTNYVWGNSADSLFFIGQYKEASLEYERIIAFSKNQIEINEARYHKSECYKQLSMFDKALNELLKISYWNLADSSRSKFRYETALCSYLSGNFNETLLQIGLLEQTDIKLIPSKQNTLLLIKALTYNELMQWEKAYGAAIVYVDHQYSGPVADSLKQILVKQYSKRNLPKIRSEKKANVLRMLPGLGQAYAGNVTEGIVNFTLNLAFLSFGAYEIYKGFYITGYFVGAIGLNKVYFGGHARTAFLLQKNNYKKQRQFCDNLKSILIAHKG